MNIFKIKRGMWGIGRERKANLSITGLYRNLRLYKNCRTKSKQTAKDKERDKIARQIVDDFLI